MCVQGGEGGRGNSSLIPVGKLENRSREVQEGCLKCNIPKVSPSHRNTRGTERSLRTCFCKELRKCWKQAPLPTKAAKMIKRGRQTQACSQRVHRENGARSQPLGSKSQCWVKDSHFKDEALRPGMAHEQKAEQGLSPLVFPIWLTGASSILKRLANTLYCMYLGGSLVNQIDHQPDLEPASRSGENYLVAHCVQIAVVRTFQEQGQPKAEFKVLRCLSSTFSYELYSLYLPSLTTCCSNKSYTSLLISVMSI